jgi:hypothetical protein
MLPLLATCVPAGHEESLLFRALPGRTTQLVYPRNASRHKRRTKASGADPPGNRASTA